MRSSLSLLTATAVALTTLTAAPAEAQITWNWSFGSESGQFVTDGTSVGGVVAAGSYTFSDFIVLSSGSGAPVGSVSGGEYTVGGLATIAPYTLQWDGSAVTEWTSAGANLFEWWLFQRTGTSEYYAFGWETGNQNTVDQAAYLDVLDPALTNLPSFAVSVAPATAAVPEPSAALLLVAGGAAALQRRGRRAT